VSHFTQWSRLRLTNHRCRFQTYFPHIDNVYSHRSTQRHKRKRFVSHYWDCRLKGRPPGTKKSTDPEKKKRKRVARERDLCDVKVKITEYFDQNEYEEQLGQKPPGAVEDYPSSPIVAPRHGQTQQYLEQTWGALPNAAPPTLSRKFYTFQRVNGNGGNGKGDGIAGPHKHSLADSDRVKKNSVIRWLAKCEKEDRKNLQVRSFSLVSLLILVFRPLSFISMVHHWACAFSHIIVACYMQTMVQWTYTCLTAPSRFCARFRQGHVVLQPGCCVVPTILCRGF
jgi:hypothetical protein